MHYLNAIRKLGELQADLKQFEVEFIDRDGFKRFADNLSQEVGNYSQLWITGYFSESVRDSLEIFAKNNRLKLLTQEFDVSRPREKKNLEVLRKLCKIGAEVKVNSRLHARFLLAHSPEFPAIGLLVIGSFDFNTEGVSKERYDAGIKTKNPDLVLSAKELFMKIWDESESVPLNEKYPESYGRTVGETEIRKGRIDFGNLGQ